MKTFKNIISSLSRLWRYLLFATLLTCATPESAVYSQTGLEAVNDALEAETANVIETGRLIANIIVVIAFVLLMLNIVFKVMDNSKATVVFLFILFLRGLYEVIF